MSHHQNTAANVNIQATDTHSRDLIIMHLNEVRRLAGSMAEEIDQMLFSYVIDMAAELVHENLQDPMEIRVLNSRNDDQPRERYGRKATA